MLRWALFSVLVSVLVLGLAAQAYAPSHPEYVGFDAPLRQIVQGVFPNEVKCNQGLELIIKHNGSPACVRLDTAVKLEERGWGVMPPPCCKDMPHEESQIQDIPVTECSGIARCFSGTVTQVIDGDTIYTDTLKIRLSLTNTPERGEDGFAEATEFTRNLCPVGSVILFDQDDLQKVDVYGRVLGEVWCEGKLLNSELLYAGHANILARYCSTSEFAGKAWAKEFGC